jgi:hypothetical protein
MMQTDPAQPPPVKAENPTSPRTGTFDSEVEAAIQDIQNATNSVRNELKGSTEAERAADMERQFKAQVEGLPEELRDEGAKRNLALKALAGAAMTVTDTREAEDALKQPAAR